MSLTRTPVQIKTAKARKIDGKNRVELANIEAISNGIAGILPDSVNMAIADSHARIHHRRVQVLGEVGMAFDMFKAGTGNISEFINAVSMLPAAPMTGRACQMAIIAA